jgi:hypothetical protein
MNLITLKIETMTIHEFTKLNFTEKTEILKTEANLIDQYMDQGNLIYNYQLYSFFVEATIDLETESMTDITPFKRGFLLDRSYLLKQPASFYNLFSYTQVA